MKRPPTAPTAETLDRWLGAAKHAHESLTLSPDDATRKEQLRALAAMPDRHTPGATWYLEERERTRRDMERDTRPTTDSEVCAWVRRQADRAAQMASLMDAHVEALNASVGTAAQGNKRKRAGAKALAESVRARLEP